MNLPASGIGCLDMRKNTASPNVHTLHHEFYMPQLNRHRSIYIYLPPDYYTSEKFYPVIYAQDGQNLFNEATAFQHEWRIDKTLDKLHKQKDYGAIVVGIAHGGLHRLDEYSAWHRNGLGGGQAEKYVHFLADTLKPYVDTHFRTLAKPESTVLLGSSMGGLLALYGVLRRKDAFLNACAFSPSFGFASEVYPFAEQHISSAHRVYLAGSKTENRFMGNILQGMYWSLHKGGLPDERLRIVLRDRGKHNEIFWRNEFKKAYTWLR